MSTKVYNILWADDEYATLKNDPLIRRLFDNKNIEVLKYVATSDELKAELENYKDKVDAVIIDGNFSQHPTEYVEKDDISGLIHTLTFIDVFNTRRDIPFFLCTSKKVFLQEICKNGELDYFNRYNRLIQKGEMDMLTQRIVEDVEKVHTTEFLVRKRNKPLLDVAKSVDEKCEEHLYNFLLDEARDITCKRSVDMFNQLRLILERIHALCLEAGIIPSELSQLNNLSYYFYYNTNKSNLGWCGYRDDKQKVIYKPAANVMPIPVARSLSTLIEITQDGSHNRSDLTLFVSEYVNDAQTPFLFRSCLYMVMDLLRWYDDLKKKIESEEMDWSKLYTKEVY